MGRKKGRRRSPFKINLKKDTLHSLASLTLIVLGLLIIVSFTGQGKWLQSVQNLLQTKFGAAMLIMPFLFFSAGLMLTKLNWKIAHPNVLLGAILVFISALGTWRSGEIGQEIFLNLAALIHSIGAMILLIAIGLGGILIMTESSLDDALLTLSNAWQFISKIFSGRKKEKKEEEPAFATKGSGDFKIKGGTPQPEVVVDPEPKLNGAKKDKKKDSKKKQPDGELSDEVVANVPGEESDIFQLPPTDMLSNISGAKADRGDVKKNAAIIEKTLDSFGIQARVVEVNLGPAVTQYALEIALGTKLSRITALQNDLALALAAPTGQIRIEAPIPGKSMVGIEIPNRTPEMVSMRQMLTSEVMENSKSKLAVALGLNVSGEAVVADIAKMPHVLIAGATGSGKSVSINSMIASILFRATPDEVKFILVDPKRVELTGYNDIPHLLTPVIVDPEKVVASLEWAIAEMDKRYKLFAEVGVRNIESYNDLSGFQALPYIVIIIDELADIMLFAPQKVEDAITRLAQMARATGIHLILATQRPSVDVITGLIKANIPCRIAFNVTSMVDSRVIIDNPGAEKLLGKGDMLYIPPTQSKPTRIQGTYVSDSEIRQLIDFLKQTSPDPEYTEEVTTKFAPKKIKGPAGIVEELDELFEDAVRVITKYDKGSASLLQRRLSIGYARAARILDQLQQAGIVGPPDGSKPRDVLIRDAEEYFASQGEGEE